MNYPEDAQSISQKKVYDQNARLRLIQDTPNAILYSIHQNSYPKHTVSGFQVLYGHDNKSKTLGMLLQDNYNKALSISKGRYASEISNDIYLLKHCDCTAVLVECGFISNENECKLLQSDSYQKKLTIIMLASYLEYTG